APEAARARDNAQVLAQATDAYNALLLLSDLFCPPQALRQFVLCVHKLASALADPTEIHTETALQLGDLLLVGERVRQPHSVMQALFCVAILPLVASDPAQVHQELPAHGWRLFLRGQCQSLGEIGTRLFILALITSKFA